MRPKRAIMVLISVALDTLAGSEVPSARDSVGRSARLVSTEGARQGGGGAWPLGGRKGLGERVRLQ